MNLPAHKLFITLLIGTFFALSAVACVGADGDNALVHEQEDDPSEHRQEPEEDAGAQVDAGADAPQGSADASRVDASGEVGSAEIAPPGRPKEDSLGAPCSSGQECPSGHCASVGGQERGVCSTRCEDESGCPSGWSCEAVDPAQGAFCSCESSQEICDGEDNDCDGLIDEGGDDSLCGEGDLCVDGACTCPSEFSCDGACYDLRNDAENCGQCGNTCETACSGGECVSVVEVSLGGDHLCAILSDGRLRCAGENSHGQLGDGTTTASERPVDVLWMQDTQMVAVDDHFSCASNTKGEVFCWGYNRQGQVASRPYTERHRPTHWAQLESTVDLSVRNYTGCTANASGEAYCWGGQSDDEPLLVEGLVDARHVAVGDHHRCALITAGQVACWGENGEGQLGDGSTLNRDTIKIIPMFSDVVQIAAGEEHSCVLQAGGKVYCFGSDAKGQLGDNDALSAPLSASPVEVRGLPEVSDLSAGSQHTCAVSKERGDVLCWGANDQGQLGDGSTSDIAKPVLVRGLPAVKSVQMGDKTSCAVSEDGDLYCWGDRYGVNPRKVRW